jgi:hypothetical protein
MGKKTSFMGMCKSSLPGKKNLLPGRYTTLQSCQGDQIGRIFTYVLDGWLLSAILWKLQKYVSKYFGYFFYCKSNA